MHKRIWIGMTAAAVVWACASTQTSTNAPPSPIPAPPSASAGPTSGSQPAASTPLNTAVGSPAASPVSSAGALATVADFGAHIALFEDQFDDPESGWGTGSTQGGDVQYVGGALVFDFAAENNWLWSTRPLASPQNVVHVEAAFTPSASGYQGLLCADSDELMYGAVATAEGRWAFITLTDVRADLLTTEEHPAWTIAPAASTRIALDCAVTSTGSFRMQLSLPDVGLAAHYDDGAGGVPATLDRVGIYGEAVAPDFTLSVDDFSAFGASNPNP